MDRLFDHCETNTQSMEAGMFHLAAIALLAIPTWGAPPIDGRVGGKPTYLGVIPSIGGGNDFGFPRFAVDQSYPDIIGLPDPGARVEVGPRDRVVKDPVFALASNCKYINVELNCATTVLQQLAALDFVPADRLEYFAYLNREDLRIISWRSHVESLTRTRDGVFVRARVTPQLRQTGVVALATLDGFAEFYLLDSQSRLHYVGGRAAPAFIGGGLIEF